jgi:cytochrome bd ubiquinol oxidase subunit I
MDATVLSRLQFAFTIGFHILWPTLPIGLSAFVAWLSMLWWWTGRPVYRDLMRFWMQLFALGFGMGVITGLVMSYEIGTNWAGFSKAVGNVLGPLFMYEAATAFFLESGFVGIMLFAEGRVSRGLHLFACVMVALGSLMSASWILAANSWMQTPAGAVADAEGIFHVVSWWNVVFNPSFPFRFMHMVCASFLTGAVVVAGVSAFQLLRWGVADTSRIAFSLAMWAALVLAPLQIAFGDRQGLNTAHYQPAKLAAMEGLWDTEHNVPMTVFAWPDMSAERNLYEVSIPHLASLYLTHSWDGEVQGLKATPPADRPYVPVVFFAFRVMVGIGTLLLALAITGAVLRSRGRLYDARWFHYAAVAATPLGFVAVLAGWIVTETGRQPFVVYGLLRTADAVSPVSPGAITLSLIGFLLIYALLFAVFLWFSARLIFRGPGSAGPVAQAGHPWPASTVTIGVSPISFPAE